MKIKPIIVTLTSIPPRFENLPRRFAAIERQTVKPDLVELYLPKSYRRFSGPRPALPPLPDWVRVVDVEDDLGPATKILPATRKWRSHDVDLLLCDDDRLQDRQWIARLARTRRERPRDIICERAWNIDERFGIERKELDYPRALLAKDGGRTLFYRLVKQLTLKKCHHLVPRRIYANPGYADVFEGFLGALVPPQAFHEDAWNIPDVVWTVDDVWLSGMAMANGYRVWANGIPRPVYHDGTYDKIAALRDFSESGVGREGADRMAVDMLRSKYGIWH
ncbi:glycosyltransferase family 2 protein [bacterium]|nr:glycosyltransferase family 2 protein [bacterium]